MKKTNKSGTLSLSVSYVYVYTDTPNDIAFADEDIHAIDWYHGQGYKASIEGNTLVITKDYGWGKVSSRYVIVPDIHYHSYRENRNYKACIESAKRFAMIHTLSILNRINSGR